MCEAFRVMIGFHVRLTSILKIRYKMENTADQRIPLGSKVRVNV
jgi:hypothetical protein